MHILMIQYINKNYLLYYNSCIKNFEQAINMRRQKAQSGQRSFSYKKQVVQQKTTSKIKEGFFNLTTNISFSIGGGLNKLKDFINMDSDKQYSVICIHGKKFATEKQAKHYLNKIVWFSYRKLPGLSKQIHSDTGWGCLIRVGQMALAAGLKAFFEQKNNVQQKILIHQKVIVSFVQNGGSYQKYSLKKIVQRANKKYNIKYGQWFNTTQICQVLAYLHSKDPMKGAQNLILINFRDSIIFLDEIYTSMNKKMCTCKKRRVLCPICNQTPQKQQSKPIQTLLSVSSIDPIKQKTNYNPNSIISKSQISPKKSVPEKKLMVFVGCRLGCQKIGITQYNQLIQLLGLDISLGIIGGIPRKGFYFVGYYNDQLIYLDPHLVQNQVTLSNVHIILKSFEYGDLRRVGRNSIDPSMAFVFYINSLESLNKLCKKIQDIKQRYDNPIIIDEWTNQHRSQSKCSNIQQLQQQNNDLDNSFIEQLEN